jgi:hypothetical protein
MEALSVLAASSTGIGAWCAIRGDRGAGGRVLGIAQRSLYCELGQQIVCVGTEEMGRGPLNVLLPRAEWAFLRDAVGRGDIVGFGSYAAEGRVIVQCREATVFKQGLSLSPLVRLPELRRIREFAAKRGRGPLVPVIRSSAGEDRTALTFEGVVADRVTRSLGLLRESWQGCNSLSTIQKAVRGLIGIGPGSTPSGDDVLVGYLGGLELSGQMNSRARRLYAEHRTVLADAIQFTSPISRAHLEWAIRGFYSESFLELLESLKQPGMRKIESCLSRVVEQGASSGTDTIVGLVSALEHGKEEKYDNHAFG